MALIHFTPEDYAWVNLPPLTPNHQGPIAIRIEEAADCEGIACGERLEAALSPEDLERWHETHANRGPVQPHSHMIATGLDPQTRSSIIAIRKGRA